MWRLRRDAWFEEGTRGLRRGLGSRCGRLLANNWLLAKRAAGNQERTLLGVSNPERDVVEAGVRPDVWLGTLILVGRLRGCGTRGECHVNNPKAATVMSWKRDTAKTHHDASLCSFCPEYNGETDGYSARPPFDGQ